MPRSILIYGESGETKTTQLYFLAKYIQEKTNNKKIRLISGDGGGSTPFLDSGMVDSKQVDLFDFSIRTTALADCKRLAEGYWPRDVKTKDGKIIKNGYFKSDDKCVTTPEQFAGIGAYFIEGFTSIGKLLLSHCSKQEEGVGFKHSYKYEEDGYVIGGLQEGHYGLVQKQLYEMHVQGFNTLPVDYVIWTALVGKGDNKRTKETTYGPLICGNAPTGEAPQWFGDTWYLRGEDENTEEGKIVHRKYGHFSKMYDPETNVPYPAKVRCLPELLPKVYENFPGGKVRLEFDKGLDKFYRKMDEIGGR